MLIVGKYRKLPVEIEAELYKVNCGMEDGTDWGQLCDGIFYPTAKDDLCGYGMPFIKTLEGKHYISKGDWIITGVKGERYPCKPDVFEMTYEKVVDVRVMGYFDVQIAPLHMNEFDEV